VRCGRAVHEADVLQQGDVPAVRGERGDRVVEDVERADEPAPELLGDVAVDVRVVEADGARTLVPQVAVDPDRWGRGARSRPAAGCPAERLTRVR
jgi:hypothetical protein